MRRKLLIALAVVAALALTGKHFTPPPEKAHAVADYTTDGMFGPYYLPAGATDWTWQSTSGWAATAISIEASTSDIFVFFNGETTTDKQVKAGKTVTWTNLENTVTSITIDRSVADGGPGVMAWREKTR